ncbi:MAG TPA: hypothetical protein PLW35_10515, partial [Verrucomicrobiota bacterium]|nr:hypothetical protein [Verrucomicrobiota bacterium]
GVGRREALGVRQLAAALLSCASTVPVPISACHRKHRACPRKSIRGIHPQTSAAADWNKRQFAGRAAIQD